MMANRASPIIVSVSQTTWNLKPTGLFCEGLDMRRAAWSWLFLLFALAIARCWAEVAVPSASGSASPEAVAASLSSVNPGGQPVFV